MALKTYITTIERLKKYEVSDYLRYLLSDDHKNHFGRTEIISNSQDPKDFFMLNAEKIRGSIRRRIERRRKKSRGWHNNPLSDSNRTLVFSLPVAYEGKTSKEQMISIQKALIEEIIVDYAKNGVKITEKDLFSNIHLQRNNHINFIIPGIDSDYKIIHHIRGDSYRFKLAEKFTEIVDKTLGTDFNQYSKAEETLAIIDKETIKMENDFYSVEELARLKDEKGINGYLKRLYGYYYRAAKRVEEADKIITEAKDDAKLLKQIENTLTKAFNDESISKEEKAQAKAIFKALEVKFSNKKVAKTIREVK